MVSVATYESRGLVFESHEGSRLTANKGIRFPSSNWSINGHLAYTGGGKSVLIAPLDSDDVINQAL